MSDVLRVMGENLLLSGGHDAGESTFSFPSFHHPDGLDGLSVFEAGDEP